MWKRLTLSITVAVAVVSLVAGASFALFTSSTGNANNSFTSGTVTLGTPANTMVDVNPMVPGDGDTKTYSVQYTGSVGAWLGLIYTVSGDLTTCDGGGRFTVNVTDGNGNTYQSSGDPQVILGAQGAAAAAGQSTTKNFTIAYSLALGTGNDCQDKTAQINFQVIAVQAGNNTNNAGNGPITWGIGNPPDSACVPTGGYVDSQYACPVAASPIVGTVTGGVSYDWNTQPMRVVPADGARWYKLHLTPGNYQFSLAAQGGREMAIWQGPVQWPAVGTIVYDEFGNHTASLTVSSESDYYLVVTGNPDGGPFTVTWGAAGGPHVTSAALAAATPSQTLRGPRK